ncbi:MAG: hypothetical protein OXH90_00555 [Paracoccaceae bacterium]|nr:hypothetical protein [Paracoccaceae bacterium]MDE2915679.1 hypothetical protein [Paracoccaceae bacterium]
MQEAKRVLSNRFMVDLNKSILQPLLERIKQDDTLMLAIRKDYINIYYRGGSILKIKLEKGIYTTKFDKNYSKSGKYSIPEIPEKIREYKDSEACVNELQNLKKIMDRFFSVNPRTEREFQQLIVRENNLSKARTSGYYVTDIEYKVRKEDNKKGPRFDIIALKHPYNQRNVRFKPVLIEMKYGDKSIVGDSDIIKHLEDINEFLKNEKKYEALLKTMKSQFCQLNELGLIKYKNYSKNMEICIDKNEKLEVVCILANQNLRLNFRNHFIV